jgi:hypothetical protein
MFLIRLAVSTSQISTLPLSFPTARYDPSDAHDKDVTIGSSVSLLTRHTYQPSLICYFVKISDSHLRMQPRHIPRLGIPNIDRISQGDGHLVRTTPTDQVQVIIIHKPRRIQYPIRSLR